MHCNKCRSSCRSEYEQRGDVELLLVRGSGTVKTVEALEALKTLEAAQLVDKQGGGLFHRLTLLSLAPTNHSRPECGSGGGDWPLWARCTAALLRRLFFVPAAPHTHCLTIVVVVVRPPASQQSRHRNRSCCRPTTTISRAPFESVLYPALQISRKSFLSTSASLANHSSSQPRPHLCGCLDPTCAFLPSTRLGLIEQRSTVYHHIDSHGGRIAPSMQAPLVPA